MNDPEKNGKTTGERWAKLAARAVVDRNLKALDVRVLGAIGVYAGRDGTAWPSQETIASMLGVTRETVCKAIKRLRKHGYLDRYRQQTSRGWHRNVYRLLFPEYVPIPSRLPLEESDPAVTQHVTARSHGP
jgi:DNA-binding transcriptional MocR family regulator